MSFVSVFTDHVRADRIRRYEELVTELAAEARKKKEAWHWVSHQVGFGPLARIYHVSQHEDWADLEKHGDARGLFERVLGEKRGQKVLEEANECLVSTERSLGLHRPELSYPKEPAERVARITSLVLVRARPGHQETVEELFRNVAEAIPKAGESARIATFQAVTGDMLGYWLVRPLDRLSDLDKQSIGRDLLLKALGQSEGARAYRNGLEGVDQVQREIVAYREDLSNPAG